MDVYNWYKTEHKLYLHHIPLVPMLIKGVIRILWGGVIPYQAQIGKGTTLGYQGLGIVINKNSIIGENCTICQNVTLGAGGPKLGNNVMVGAGAVILGNVNIGDNVDIGANAVVLNDIPNNAVAVGCPARIVKYKI